MITFQIDHERFCNEPIIVSMYAETFCIGSSHHSDVKIITFKNDLYLEVKQSEKGVFIKSLNKHSFLHNNKKYLGQRKCNIGDIFQIDRSFIKVTNIDLNSIATPINFNEDKTLPKYKIILKAIQKELIYSDKDF